MHRTHTSAATPQCCRTHCVCDWCKQVYRANAHQGPGLQTYPTGAESLRAICIANARSNHQPCACRACSKASSVQGPMQGHGVQDLLSTGWVLNSDKSLAYIKPDQVRIVGAVRRHSYRATLSPQSMGAIVHPRRPHPKRLGSFAGKQANPPSCRFQQEHFCLRVVFRHSGR